MKSKPSLAGALRRGVFPHQLSWLLDVPLRNLIISPRELADRLSLTPSSRILEVGPGSGFFSRELASRVPNGRLELFDLQAEMLEKARRKIEQSAFENVGYSVGDAGRAGALPYAPSSFDVVLMVAVLGEVSDPQACLRSVRDVLCSSGSLVCHESLADPDMIRVDTLVELGFQSGLKLEQHWGGAWNYTAKFSRTVTGGRP